MSASAPLLPSVAKELPDTARDAYAAATEDVQTRLTRRLPPLVLTLCIEMGNAAIIMSYSGELLRYPLLVGFIPVISALGGNIGLQSSSITTSALTPLVGVGVINIERMYRGFRGRKDASYIAHTVNHCRSERRIDHHSYHS